MHILQISLHVLVFQDLCKLVADVFLQLLIVAQDLMKNGKEIVVTVKMVTSEIMLAHVSLFLIVEQIKFYLELNVYVGLVL